jgi:bacterioferritin-associated ferredoxin
LESGDVSGDALDRDRVFICEATEQALDLRELDRDAGVSAESGKCAHTVLQISSLTSTIQSFIPDDESGFTELPHQEHLAGETVFMRSVNHRNMQDTSEREELIETW